TARGMGLVSIAPEALPAVPAFALASPSAIPAQGHTRPPSRPSPSNPRNRWTPPSACTGQFPLVLRPGSGFGDRQPAAKYPDVVGSGVGVYAVGQVGLWVLFALGLRNRSPPAP